jgi:hypothetical protein
LAEVSVIITSMASKGYSLTSKGFCDIQQYLDDLSILLTVIFLLNESMTLGFIEQGVNVARGSCEMSIRKK